jgi:ATP-dependent DNA helicase RecG
MEAALQPGADAGSAREIGSGRPLSRSELLAAPLRSWPSPAVLDAPLTKLRGAGPKLSEAAAEIGIECLGDLLRHIPRGHRDRASPVGLADLKLGEEATVRVEVAGGIRKRPTRRRRLTILEADVRDGTGSAKAIWFNRAWLADRLSPGVSLLLRGKLEKRGFTVAEHELLEGGGGAPAGLHTTGLVPLHPASERLRAQRIREWAWQAVPLARHAAEPLPGRLRGRLRLAAVADAITSAHFPAEEAEATEARRRLAFEELFLYQASLAARRGRRLATGAAVELPPPGAAIDGWVESLPFELTADQRRAISELWSAPSRCSGC